MFSKKHIASNTWWLSSSIHENNKHEGTSHMGMRERFVGWYYHLLSGTTLGVYWQNTTQTLSLREVLEEGGKNQVQLSIIGYSKSGPIIITFWYVDLDTMLVRY